jgi:hypothetical protein
MENTTQLNGFLYDNLAPANDQESFVSYNTEEVILNSLRANYLSVSSNDNEIYSYARLTKLKEKFIEYMNKKSASIFEFLTKPVAETDIINNVLELMNRFENKTYMPDKPITQFFDDPSLKDAKDWLDSILTTDTTMTPSQVLKKNINIVVDSWIESMTDLNKYEDILMEKIKSVQSIQKKIEVMQLLPVNECLVPVLESLEKYVELAYKDLEIKTHFENCLIYFKRIYVLHGHMRFINGMQDVGTAPMCTICFERSINTCIVPCGHTFCSECTTNQIRFQCAICRTNIISKQKIFFN